MQTLDSDATSTHDCINELACIFARAAVRLKCKNHDTAKKQLLPPEKSCSLSEELTVGESKSDTP